MKQNFNADVANNNGFKSFEYKAKLLKKAGGANEILKNATLAVPLKYLGNFWRSLEILLINYKAELKLKWTKYCVLSSAGADNDHANPGNIIVTIKDTNFNVLVVTLSPKDNQKLLKLLSKGVERSDYWDKYKTKSKNKNTTNERWYFLKWNFVGVNRLFDLVCSNQDANS